MDLHTLKTTLSLLKAEIQRAWRFPILELAIGFIVLISITATPNMFKIIPQIQLQTTLDSTITTAIYNIIDLQMLPLGLFCVLLLSLSFARDYEQGLMQTLLSSPLSRSSVFIAKFAAVVVPLTLLSWIVMLCTLALNFYSDPNLLLRSIQFAAWALPVTVLAMMFYGGLAVFISLSVRRTIPSALITTITSFVLYYLSTLTVGASSLFNYLSLSPYKAPITTLGKVFGVVQNSNPFERSLPTEIFLVVSIVYALGFVVPMYFYFTRRFEVRE
ncbi:MAG: ABC transporter permease [Candidatus Bathyarchaeota archaeon]|nr:ABC transporter permease [Candidatus Bathyarchaeota archaeon]